jgi:hypothetical protein
VCPGTDEERFIANKPSGSKGPMVDDAFRNDFAILHVVVLRDVD